VKWQSTLSLREHILGTKGLLYIIVSRMKGNHLKHKISCHINDTGKKKLVKD